MSAQARVGEPYGFEPAWERALTFQACARPTLWGRAAHAVDPELLGAPEAKLAFSVAGQVAREAAGRGPEKPLVVLQRARRWVDDGRATREQVLALAAYFDAAEDDGLISEEGLAAELVPVLQQRLRQQAAYAAADEMKSGGDMSRTQALIGRANRLGQVDEGLGLTLDQGALVDALERLRSLEVLPVGVTELDIRLDGGMRRGCLGVLLGGTGSGKSMGLVHIAAEAIRSGLFVAYATLELMPVDVTCRLVANLTGIPIKVLLSEDSAALARRLAAALDPTHSGKWRCHEFAPLVSTFDDVAAWVARCEEVAGRPIDLLCTDYADKLGAPKSAGKERESSYGTGRAVYEPMRHYAAKDHPGGPIWSWTASAATRKKDSKRRLGLDDVADSMHKVRVPDLVLGVDYDEEERQISLGVLKNRFGEPGARVGPLPTDFACGRLAPIPEDVVGPDRAFASATASALRKAPPL